ncbi:MAG: hypothetical protein E7525_04720 [Ruminococcaceae bacterium]|nr:hypothetical protein [Oscillospiraceae bacterium]
MKKFLSLTLALIIALMCVGCKGKKDTDTINDPANSNPISSFDNEIFIPEDGDSSLSGGYISNSSVSPVPDGYVAPDSSGNGYIPGGTTGTSGLSHPDLSQYQDAKGFLIKDKKYKYQGNDVLILHITNKTSTNYNIAVICEYFDSEGYTIKTETKTFEGFAAGYENYFVFVPRIVFSSHKISVKTQNYNGVAFASYLETKDNPGQLTVGAMSKNGSLDLYATIGISFQRANTYNKNLYYAADYVVFNNKGEICYIDNMQLEDYMPPIGTKDPTTFRTWRPFYQSDVLMINVDKFVWPEELTGSAGGIMAIKAVSDKYLY